MKGPGTYPLARDTTQGLKASIRQNNMYGVIHIVEAWAYVLRHPNDHTYR